MLLIRREILGRRFCTAARRAKDIMPNPDCRPTSLSLRVSYLVALGDLDTAAKYARLAVFTGMKSDLTTATTCGNIIGNMVREKRHKDAYDLYDFFFNFHLAQAQLPFPQLHSRVAFPTRSCRRSSRFPQIPTRCGPRLPKRRHFQGVDERFSPRRSIGPSRSLA